MSGRKHSDTTIAATQFAPTHMYIQIIKRKLDLKKERNFPLPDHVSFPSATAAANWALFLSTRERVLRRHKVSHNTKDPLPLLPSLPVLAATHLRTWLRAWSTYRCRNSSPLSNVLFVNNKF